MRSVRSAARVSSSAFSAASAAFSSCSRAHQLCQRGADVTVAARRHVEAGARAACQLARLQRQAVQPAQRPRCHRHRRQRRQQADRQHAQQHHAPGMALARAMARPVSSRTTTCRKPAPEGSAPVAPAAALTR